jgi:glycosyltransferase involved in cell wall biosynthesis
MGVRIALDATYATDAQPSGVGIYSRRILDGLAERYPEDTFLHCLRPKKYFRERGMRRENVRLRMLLAPVPLFSAVLRADLFHALNQRVDRRPARRVISTFHDLFVITAEYSTPEFRQRFAKQARRAAAASDLIIAVSAFTANQVEELLGVERSRIRVIGHGADLPEPSTAPREPIVLSVGVLQKRKNILRLIQAFERMPAPWRLALAGSPSGYGSEEISDYLARSPARERIDVLGYVSAQRLADLYRRASIVAFPSIGEGFGIPVLEAMAHGVPVLTSRAAALPEVAGDAALLVDALRTDEIAGGLIRLAEDAELRETMSRKGRARAAEFPWQRAVEATHRVYEELK